MCRYENIIASEKNFLNDIYIHHNSQSYAFKIYIISLALYTYGHIVTSVETDALNLKQILTQNFIKDLV